LPEHRDCGQHACIQHWTVVQCGNSAWRLRTGRSQRRDRDRRQGCRPRVAHTTAVGPTGRSAFVMGFAWRDLFNGFRRYPRLQVSNCEASARGMCALQQTPPKLLPLETLISEYGPGQYELTLQYRSDLRRAADDLGMLKRLVRPVARRHGMTACFTALSFGLVHASPLSTLPPRIANGCSSLARQSARDYAAPELLWGAGPHPARLRCFKAGVILAMTARTTSHARG
jgi:Glutamine synthetase, catalytic domain